MQRLYELGARTVVVTGTGPMGCAPAERAMRGRNGGCSTELQQAASLFNPQLDQMLNQLNTEIGTNVFISANTRDMHMDFINDPQAFGTSLSTFFLFKLCLDHEKYGNKNAYLRREFMRKPF